MIYSVSELGSRAGGFPCRPLCHWSRGVFPGGALWDGAAPSCCPRAMGPAGRQQRCVPRGWILQPCWDFQSWWPWGGHEVGPRMATRSVPATGGVPQRRRVGCGAAQDGHVSAAGGAVSRDTVFCNLNWLNLVRAEFQRLSVTSQQFAGNPPALLPQSACSSEVPLPSNPLQTSSDGVCGRKTRGVCTPRPRLWCCSVLASLCEGTCLDLNA